MAKRVLVVDDAAFMRMMLSDHLTKGGFEVVGQAENGLVAISKYKELRPDIVTMDITMPEMDGISAVKEIRKIDPQARIVMCSAMGQQHMVMEAIQAGARDFIVKPFDPTRVVQAVTKALA
ncbi:MAG: response regulator [Bacillota bacterium]|nr:response regulator [Bacillota bacterium]